MRKEFENFNVIINETAGKYYCLLIERFVKDEFLESKHYLLKKDSKMLKQFFSIKQNTIENIFWQGSKIIA